MSNELQTRIKQSVQYLERFRQAPLGHFIGGESVVGDGKQFKNHSPIDGADLGMVCSATASEVDRACRAASDAFGDWRRASGKARRQILIRVAELIEARAEEIAMIECVDTGQAWRFMSKAAVRGAENYRFFADRAPGANDGLSLPTDSHLNYTVRQPIGPVGVITPWNTPFMLSTWKIAPALAAGCTVVHKPAEWSPLTARVLMEIMHEAGLPDGVANLVNGIGESTGKALTEHPDIRAVAFIGESETGGHIMAQGAPTLKRVHLELGGKNPVIVFDDADLDTALDAVVFMIYSLNGERCTSSSRLLIQRSVHDEFIARLTDRVKALRVGHPLDSATEVGPLIHQRHLEKVLSYAQIAREDGATIAVGGAQCEEAVGVAQASAGHFVQPTLYTNATQRMRIAQEEIFGPVLTTVAFDTEQEAIPFGGMKSSGIGRDGGDYSFDFYMETKNVALALGQHNTPRMGLE